MNNIHTAAPASSIEPTEEWPDVVLGLWLRSVWLGSTFAIAGFVMLVAGEPHAAIGFTLLVAGGAFARYSWGRARALMHVLEEDVADSAPATTRARASDAHSNAA